MTPRTAGLGYAIASAIAFGGSGPFARPLIDAGLHPLHVTWLRLAGAALLLLPVAIAHRGALRTRPGLLIAYGVFPMAGVQAFYFAAIARVPVGVALLIEFLGPVFVLAWIRLVRRRRVPRTATLGVILAVTGLACVVEVWAGLRFDALGLLLALGAAGCQAAYFLLSDTHDDRPPVAPLAVIAYGTLVATAVVTLIARPWTIPVSVLAQPVPVGGLTLPGWTAVAWIVAVCTVLAYITGVAAVRRLSAPVAGAVACLEAVVATALAWVLLGEHLTWPQILGGLIILTGAFIAQRAANTPTAPAAAPARENTR
ncbi:EamA family transporter [Allonocardiopsis opalescens]|uniref:Threonine/homoserine efflux transporter RhtA n=1 Tax=Allonocardiopsis opalescens TaxID=1144618 RepID=A0A2T0PTQ2_9ACTN|nr:EamA family transporter [Allonocardiopsis opalescens]PRX92274.1 threonine/homoserine efflux transporter RhtA [Allonocardiopsis opalescens]